MKVERIEELIASGQIKVENHTGSKIVAVCLKAQVGQEPREEVHRSDIRNWYLSKSGDTAVVVAARTATSCAKNYGTDVERTAVFVVSSEEMKPKLVHVEVSPKTTKNIEKLPTIVPKKKKKSSKK